MLLAILLISCASGESIPPPGGPPDTEPPTIEKASPPDGTTNFSDRTVEITFNEYLQEGRESEHVIITPIPKRTPEFDWSGKTLEITFRDDLAENRTYAVTIGAGMTDLTGNRLGNPYTLRFSTGSVIDSGRIAGSIAGKGDRKAFIFGYLLPDDAATFTDTLRPDMTIPDFITPVADNGSFSMEGLPPGEYRLIAVTDEFSDRLYTPGTDAYGVAVDDITVPDDYAPVYGLRIRLLPAPVDTKRPQLLSAAGINRTTTELRFTEPIDTGSIRPERIRLEVDGTERPVALAWRSAESPLNIRLSHDALPSGATGSITLTDLTDSTGLRLEDTARTATFTIPGRNDTIPPKLIAPADLTKGFRMTDTLLIAFNEAVGFEERRDVVRLRDTSKNRETTFRVRRRSPDAFIALPRDTTFDAVGPILSIDLNAFPDRAGNRTDSVWAGSVRLKPVPQRGTLTGTLTDSLAPNVPHVIVFESTEEGYRFEIRLDGTGQWELSEVPSGNYSMSAFRDVNNDGEYDYGSLNPFRRGEVFVEREGGVRVRPRWTTTDIDLSF